MTSNTDDLLLLLILLLFDDCMVRTSSKGEVSVTAGNESNDMRLVQVVHMIACQYDLPKVRASAPAIAGVYDDDEKMEITCLHFS